MIIFGTQLIIAVFLLSIDVAHQLKQWHLEHDKDSLYSAMYSLAIILYVIFGIIDQSKIILDWPLLVFRLSYIGIFLMTYVTTLQHEAFHEQYLIEEKPIS